MPGVTPTKSGHNARRWCGHTCVVYAINPGIHAPPSIFTTAHAHPPLTNARGHIQIGGMGPRSFVGTQTRGLGPYTLKRPSGDRYAEYYGGVRGNGAQRCTLGIFSLPFRAALRQNSAAPVLRQPWTFGGSTAGCFWPCS